MCGLILEQGYDKGRHDFSIYQPGFHEFILSKTAWLTKGDTSGLTEIYHLQDFRTFFFASWW